MTLFKENRLRSFLMAGCALILTLVMFMVVSIRPEAAAAAVRMSSPVIQGNNVVISISGTSIPASDDGVFHLIAQEVYQKGAVGVEVAQAPIGKTANFAFPLNHNTASSNLYRKFVVCVRSGGVLKNISAAKFVVNPEAIANHTSPRLDRNKKGVLAAAELLKAGTLKDLGVSQCTYNLRMGDLCSGGGVNYTYNGKTYSFNGAVVASYDDLVPMLNGYGISVTMIVLNNLGGDPALIHPLSRGHAGANYYAFNTADQAGTEKIAAAMSFLAERYSGNGHGTIDNWVVGNEVNARAMWNWMQPVDLKSYANEYAKTVRVFYNAIKSNNANARVYAAVDQQFAKSSNDADYYGGRPFLEAFNSVMVSQGNVDWGVAVHPYNFPLYEPMVWVAKPQVTHDQSSMYVTMQNIDVLTDFLSTPAMLSPNRQVRSVICSEQGYTSSNGEHLQAASVVYGYRQAVMNQHIDGFMVSRELESVAEVAQGLALGLRHPDTTTKMAYSFYKAMGTGEEAAYVKQASSIIGVADLNTLLVPR